MEQVRHTIHQPLFTDVIGEQAFRWDAGLCLRCGKARREDVEELCRSCIERDLRNLIDLCAA